MVKTLSNYDGVTIFVTHNMEEAYRMCNNLLVMDKGRTIAQGSKIQIFEHPNTLGTAKITGCKNFSRAQVINEQEIEAIDWKVNLKIIESLPNNLAYVGIRAHQITFTKDPTQINTFPCWIANILEAPHRLTLYLKLNEPSSHDKDYHLQAEIFKEKWAQIKDKPFPFYVHLNPLRLLLLE
jgi:molybdate transport system permease protein